MKLSSQILKLSNSNIVFAIFAWCLLLLRFGYRFGSADQIELLPYTLFLHNPALYPNDLFIHGLHEAVPNERTFAAYFLMPFINHLEIACLVLHVISTVILVTGLERLADLFIKSKIYIRLSILISLLLFANVTLGGVVTYSELFQASFLAAGIVVWGIIAFIERKFILCSVILSAATFVHLLEGLDVMMVLSAILLIEVFYLKKESIKTLGRFLAIYLLTAGVYLWLNWHSKQAIADAIPQKEYYDILFRFRLAHHYMLSSAPVAKTILFFILSVIACCFFYFKSRVLFVFSVISLAGMLVYAFIAEKFDSVFLVSFQFFKMAQWLKFFGLVAIFSLLESLPDLKISFIPQSAFRYQKLITTLVVTACLALSIVTVQLNGENVYEIGYWKNSYPEIDISNGVKSSIPNNAVFAVPIMFSEFKYYAQRSSYIDYKAGPRNGRGMKEWYRRAAKVYGLDSKGDKTGFEVVADADSFYFSLPLARIAELKQEGVTHILTRKEFTPAAGTLILSNDTYAVYQL